MPEAEVQLVLEMFPAQHGDAFLIRSAVRGRRNNILVDAGPRGTYRDVIRPRLAALAAAGEDLRAVIVTHIDADHIEGAIEFFEDNGASAAPSVIGVRDVWHNSYRHLQQSGTSPTPDQVSRVLNQTPRPAQAGAGDISSRQGSTLAAVLRRHGYSWNAAWNGEAAATDGTPRRLTLDDDVYLTLLSPRHQDLSALARTWRRELVTLGVPNDLVDPAAFEEAFERVIEREARLETPEELAVPISAREVTEPPPPETFREDRSLPNASSIAFLLEVGDKRVLFLGDARPTTIVTHLRALAAEPLAVGALKVSHHGSKRNTSPEFCAAIRAAHALVSTDGSKHGHPDLEALLWLVSSQEHLKLHFNYTTEAATAIGARELVERYGHGVSIAASQETMLLSV